MIFFYKQLTCTLQTPLIEDHSIGNDNTFFKLSSTMKMLNLKQITIFFFSFPFNLLLAQNYLFDVQIINIEDGLPNRRVSDIAQDKEGFIWVSTPGKISRYDGHQFKTYNAAFLNIPEYTGVTMAFDEANNLWYSVRSAATEIAYGGVLDSKRDSIYNLESFTDNQFKSKEILYINRSAIHEGEWFITTRQGKIYQYSGGSFQKIYEYPKMVTNNLIAHQHTRNSYWVTHRNEVINVVNQQVQKEFHLPFEYSYPVIASKFIPQATTSLLESYAPTGGFIYYDIAGDSLIPFTPVNYQREKITQIFHSTSTYTIFASKSNIIIQDTTGVPIFQFKEFEDRAFGATNIKANSVFLDRQNILWLGTENHGLIKITQQKNPFTLLFPKNSTRGIYRDENNQLYVGGYKGNFQRHLTTEKETNFLAPKYLGYFPIVGFHKDEQQHLWLGTETPNLLEVLPEQNITIEYECEPPTLLLLPFKNPNTQTFWVGTNHGLLQLNESTKKFVPYTLPIPSLNIEVRQFYLNQQGLWVVTSQGLFLIDTSTEELIKHYTKADGLPNLSITHLHEDKEGIFWLTSKGGGLIRWDLPKNKFTQFNHENGLSNDVIYAVYEDDYQNLWLPSNYGLMCFDKNTHTTKVYLPQNGISHEEFNTYSHFKAADGQLYFGGLNGVTSFYPEEVLQNKSGEPPLYITKVSTLEEDQETFSDKTDAFRQINRIELSPNNRILAVELSLLDFIQSAKNQYAYQIEGYQDQWIYTRENKISLINLPYGKFTLKLKGRGAAGSWSDKGLDIPLIVNKPFYLQWWFIALCFSTLGIGIYFAIKWRIANLEKDRKRLETEVKKRTLQIEKDKTIITEQAEALQALDKAKTRFFSNITHEFRTPLTLIIGPLQQMIKQPKETITPHRLKGLLYNAQNILKLINQLLDISKLEAGKMKMEITRGDIVAYTQTIIDGFEPLAHKKNHRLVFLVKENNWVTHFDKDKWDKIIYNLLFNAIKFTHEYGVIQIALRNVQAQEKEWVYLKVRDSGIGIKEVQLAQIFNRFHQADGSTTRIQEGTGIGLSLVKELVEIQGGKIKVRSKVGKGTSFEVRLPIQDAVNVASSQLTPIPSFSATTPKPSLPPIPNQSTTQGKKLKILIIEDNEELRDYIQSCVPSEKYMVITAVNGAEGIQKAQTLIPDLIISDVMMPLKDGFEVTASIRNHIATSHIPIILLTAKASLESRLEGLKRGADAYLTKPFSPEELTLRIGKLIELRRLLQIRFQNNDAPKQQQNQPATYESEDIFITRLRKFILSHLDNNELNGDLIGENFRISRMQLHRKLKALTNLSTTAFIESIRLEIAYDLLQQKELNVTEIAYRTGFNSLTHFSRKFKKKYQITPSRVQK